MFKKLLAFFTQDGQPPSAEAEPETSTTTSALPPPLNATTPLPLAADKAQTPPEGEIESSFFGEHYESLVPVWEAVLGEKETILEAFAHFSSSATPPNRDNSCHDERGVTLLVQSPSEGDMAAGVLATQQESEKPLETSAFFPLLKGYPNPLIIHDTHTWTSGREGTVAAQVYPDGSSIDFFAPFYFLDQKTFEKASQEEKPLTVELSAVAFSLRPAKALKYVAKEGPVHEIALERFLSENPEKTQADFENPTVTTDGLRLLMPTQYVCEWAYRCPVEGVEQRISTTNLSLNSLFPSWVLMIP